MSFFHLKTHVTIVIGRVMTIDKIDVSTAINKVRELLKKDPSRSLALTAAVELLITVITFLITQAEDTEQPK